LFSALTKALQGGATLEDAITAAQSVPAEASGSTVHRLHLCGDTYLCEDREKGGVGEIRVGAKVLKMGAEPCLGGRTMTAGLEGEVADVGAGWGFPLRPVEETPN
jgi:hypothetical protein